MFFFKNIDFSLWGNTNICFFPFSIQCNCVNYRSNCAKFKISRDTSAVWDMQNGNLKGVEAIRATQTISFSVPNQEYVSATVESSGLKKEIRLRSTGYWAQNTLWRSATSLSVLVLCWSDFWIPCSDREMILGDMGFIIFFSQTSPNRIFR